MDAQVGHPETDELKGLLDRFVCVRLVKMQGIDLALFQFDFDQTWAVFFMGADRTIYGRYGSREAAGEESERHVSVAGFKAAARAALALHEDPERPKAALARKTGPKPPAPTPEDMPGYQGRFNNPPPRGACMHCHNAWDGWRRATRPRGKPVTDAWLWVYPLPQVLGLGLDRDDPLKVTSVAPGSAAEKAGFQVDDRLLTCADMPLVSMADVQWVLHQAPESGRVEFEALRAGDRKRLALALSPGWRRGADLDWRPSSGPLRPGARFVALSAAERDVLGKGKPIVGLKATNVGKNREAARADLRVGDVILELDGDPTPRTPTEFIAWLYQEKRQGQSVDLLVDRDGTKERLKMDVP